MNPSQPNEPSNNMGTKDQIIERLKQAANVLVTVSNNPSVDQLAACIGFTLLLNKMGKHATAVFSGEVPSTIEFLQPEKTLEKTTDSLRDFIIALDKSKADKLRYKVEDKYVKIFITPYHTSLSEKDLEFSQGDFNVDAVVALGVKQREELDQAITAHGRILHDATVIAITTHEQGSVGAINWMDNDASSLCEMLVVIGEELKKDAFDAQMATAFLTGIVAETDRFSNDKTSPRTMTVAANLMAAGANQQLVALQLEPPEQPPVAPQPDQSKDEPPPADTKPSSQPPPPKDQGGSGNTPGGILDVPHEGEEPGDENLDVDLHKEEEIPKDEIHIDDQGTLRKASEVLAEKQTQQNLAPDQHASPNPGLVTEPPTLGGTLTANSRPEHQQLSPSTDPLSLPPVDQPLLNKEPTVKMMPSASTTEDTSQTLADIERSVGSSHVQNQSSVGHEKVIQPPQESSDLGQARNAIDKAIQSSPDTQPLGPIAALNAQPIDLTGQSAAAVPPSPTNLPSQLVPPDTGLPPEQTGTNTQPASPPPVPPPMMPPFVNPNPPAGGAPSQGNDQNGEPPNEHSP